MELERVHRDVQFLGYLPKREAAREQPKDVTLSIGQRLDEYPTRPNRGRVARCGGRDEHARCVFNYYFRPWTRAGANFYRIPVGIPVVRHFHVYDFGRAIRKFRAPRFNSARGAALAAFRTQLGYVPQDDIVHKDLTVERALYYAAKLRAGTLRR